MLSSDTETVSTFSLFFFNEIDAAPYDSLTQGTRSAIQLAVAFASLLLKIAAAKHLF